MQSKLIFLTFLLFFSIQTFAQTEKNEAEAKITELQQQKKKVRSREKQLLKKEIQKIDQLLEADNITAEEAQDRKEQAAEARARNIENQLDLINLNISLIERNKNDSTNLGYYENIGSMLTEAKPNNDYDSIPSTTQFRPAIGIGINSIFGSKGSDQRESIGYSVFAGFEFTSVLDRDHPNWHLNYGFATTLNQFQIKNNQFLLINGDDNIVGEFPYNLERQNFTFGNFIFPVNLEFSQTEAQYGNRPSIFSESNKAYYDFHSGWAYGLGGFFGFKLSSSQYFKYDLDNRFIRQTIQRNYNTNNFLYGLSAYVSWESLRLEAKYHLNDMFQSSEINGNMFALRLSVIN